MNNLKWFPRLVIVVGLIFALTGLFTAGAGAYSLSFVGDRLASQNITTPDDASIPNVPVDSIASALSMADIIQEHAGARADGLVYAEMGRFAVESGDPAGTSNGDEALKDANGNNVPNSARSTALTVAQHTTALSLSAMALGVSYGAIALGLAFTLLGIVIGGLGYALNGLINPSIAKKYGLRPVNQW